MRKLVRAQTAERLKKLDREVRKVARKPEDPDGIHDLRVAIRRLKEELEIFEIWFEPRRAKKIVSQLKKLMDRCAAVRNCDIAVEVLQASGWKDSELSAGLKRERQRSSKELSRRLERWRGRVQEWRGHLRVGQADSKESPAQNASRLLPGMIDDLFNAGSAAAQPESKTGQIHQFRLKTKRMRYTLELFEAVYGGKVKRIMDSLKSLQAMLGAINDCATTIEMIRLDRGAAAAVRRLCTKREAEFREHWKTDFVPAQRRRWKAVLSAADRTA